MIKCLASGSKGNCWAIDDGKQILILECGIPVKDMKIGIDFQISRVVGCAVTHTHKDHAGYIHQYEGCGLKVWKPYESDSTLEVTQIGAYKIKAFPLVHNVPCRGFLITHPVFGRILYATDTEYIKYRFRDLDCIIVEANYMNEMLSDDLEGTTKRNHVLRGHMELQTTRRFLQANVTERTKAIILAHLSNDNADRDKFLTELSPLFECPIWIARKGLRLPCPTER